MVLNSLILFISRLLNSMIKALNRNVRYGIAKMDEFYYSQPSQPAVVFGPSNKTWTYRDIINQAKAFAKGLTDINFIKDDVVLVKLPYEGMEENFVARIAVASLRGKVIVSKAKSIQQLQKQLQTTKARAFLYSSFDTIEDTTFADALYRFIPQMVHAPYNSEVLPRNLKFLRFLIQIDNYKYKGTFNYNRLMKFLSESEYDFGFECHENLIQLGEKSAQLRPIIVTNPSEELAFRAGVLNCLVNGKPLFCLKPSQAKHLSQQFNHEIDVICTEPLEELHSRNRVFVGPGSKLYEKHPNRRELML